MLGEEKLPHEWLERLTEREIISQVADDIGEVQTYSSFGYGGDQSPGEFIQRYPTW